MPKPRSLHININNDCCNNNYLWHIDSEHVSAVRSDVDVAPQPHVVVLALDAVEPELAEVAQLERLIVVTLTK